MQVGRPAAVPVGDGGWSRAQRPGVLKMTRGSGNVFADIGFDAEEAENLLLRAQLMSRVSHLAKGCSQREAAKKFGVSQPRLNDLMRGKIENFSLDALVNMLAHAGMRVEFRVRKAA